jgi:hypothetical protein
MPEGLHIPRQRSRANHADFKFKLVIALAALVGHKPKTQIEPACIGPILRDQLRSGGIIGGIDILPNGQAGPPLELILVFALCPFEAEPWKFIGRIGDPFYRLGHAFYAGSMAEVLVSATPEEIILQLDADRVVWVICKA